MTNTTTLTAQLAPQHQDVPLERATLGLIIGVATQAGPESLPTLEAALESAPADLMADPEHALIWQGVRTMVNRGQVPAVLELSRALSAPVSQPTWDAVVGDGTATTLAPNLERLTLLARLRSIARTCAAATAATTSGEEPEAIIGGLLKGLESGELGTARAQITSEYGSVLNHIEDLQAGRIPMVSTGFAALDRRLGGGWEQGSFVILGMKTNVGKTKFAVSVALHQVRVGQRVTYVSGELKSTAGERSTHRLKVMAVLSEARVPARLITRGTPEAPQSMSPETRQAITDAERRLNDSGLLSIYDGNLDVEVVISLMRRQAREGGGLMVIDNLDHITVRGYERKGGWEGKDEIVRRLMNAAHATKITVLALAQIKIDKTTTGEAGDMEDLGGYKGIASHADCMITAFRDRKEAETKAAITNDPWRWITEGTFNIVKRRSGVGGSVTVGWDELHGEWCELPQAYMDANRAQLVSEDMQRVGEQIERMQKKAARR
ncbi:DnaB-like helicase C-terminal domain-containing protein [Deinococcus arenicola]|uniref:SF4 helicase domain-containing protein n=1 Tax=Deinococcus arenicola TaxID=2994950 RepID=A0ABU4DVF2_9DEIO|nr:DnaB-like helicase C-terminal domain-containing protein [Deinococcus sp. ZS9-10]MDV6376426.1 hypothetical protein [Deinococcus sp. ZS9-10]